MLATNLIIIPKGLESISMNEREDNHEQAYSNMRELVNCMLHLVCSALKLDEQSQCHDLFRTCGGID